MPLTVSCPFLVWGLLQEAPGYVLVLGDCLCLTLMVLEYGFVMFPMPPIPW